MSTKNAKQIVLQIAHYMFLDVFPPSRKGNTGILIVDHSRKRGGVHPVVSEASTWQQALADVNKYVREVRGW